MCKKRQVDAQPEVAFDALNLKARGSLREGRAVSVRAPRLIFALSFLSEKEERASKSPRSFILASVFGFLQELNAGAHITAKLARIIERVGAAYHLFE